MARYLYEIILTTQAMLSCMIYQDLLWIASKLLMQLTFERCDGKDTKGKLFVTRVGRFAQKWDHYGDVIMGAIMSQITSVTQSFIQTQIKENIKALRHWPLCGEFTGDRWIPLTNGQLRRKGFHLMKSSWRHPFCVKVKQLFYSCIIKYFASKLLVC